MLKKALCILGLSFSLVSCGGHSQEALASDSPNILILGVDGGQHMVRRGNPAFRATREALAGAFFEQGFKVFDAAAISMDQVRQHLSHRSDAEIIGIARSISSPPIDIVVAFSTYRMEKDTRYAKKMKLRLAGRLIDVRTGRRLGNMTVRSNNFRHAGPNCTKGCLAEMAAHEASILAPGLGNGLALKLLDIGQNSQVATLDHEDDYPLERSQVSPPPPHILTGAFTLSFSGFKSEEMFRIEEFLVSFRGYKDHRPVRTAHRYAAYWYEADMKTARLNRNLRKMLKRMGIKGRVALEGNRISIQKFG